MHPERCDPYVGRQTDIETIQKFEIDFEVALRSNIVRKKCHVLVVKYILKGLGQWGQCWRR